MTGAVLRRAGLAVKKRVEGGRLHVLAAACSRGAGALYRARKMVKT
jgi:hypothetical protein